MANLNGLIGYSKADGTETLIASYGNDFVNVDTGAGYGQAVDNTYNTEFEVLLDNVFFQNYSNAPKNFNGTTWNNTHTEKLPISKYIKKFRTRLYLANIKIGSTTHPSRVLYSNLPTDNVLHWGYEQRTNLETIANNTLVRADFAKFKTYGLDEGDPFFITSGSDQGEFKIQEVVDDQHIILKKAPTTTASSISFWTSGNWFDVDTDDNDQLRGLGENAGRLLCFKLFSLHRFDSDNLYQVNGAVGTSSNRSIITIGNKTLYAHLAGTNADGIYSYENGQSVRISRAVQKYIKGISSSNYTSVVGWQEGNIYRLYVGDISNAQHNISVSNAVISYDTTSDALSVDTISHAPTVATGFLENDVDKTYFGTDGGEIYHTPSGYNQGATTNPIPFTFVTQDVYPTGGISINDFTRIIVFSRDANGTSVSFKPINTPSATGKEFITLGELKDDRTEFQLPRDTNKACGINLRFLESSIRENTLLIEKIIIFYINEGITQ